MARPAEVPSRPSLPLPALEPVIDDWTPPEDDLPDLGDGPEPPSAATASVGAPPSAAPIPATTAGPPAPAEPAAAAGAASASAATAEPGARPAPSPGRDEEPDLAQLPPGAQRICQLYRLSEGERRLLALLLDSEAAVTLATAERRLGLSGADRAAVVPPEGALRAHALVEAGEDAALGFLRRSDALQAARGLRELWHDDIDDAALFGQFPGAEYLPAPPPGTSWAEDLVGPRPPQPVSDLVREHLVATSARLLWLGGCGAEARGHLARALRGRLGRPVVTLDCTALLGFSAPATWAALRRLRRDCDLRGAVLIAAEVQLLGGAFRALCAPRPASQTAPIILCSAAPLGPLGAPQAGGRGETALVTRSAYLGLPDAAPTLVAPTAVPAAEVEPVSASKEDARRQAAIDAARAMGRAIPMELQAPRPAPAPAVQAQPAWAPAAVQPAPAAAPPAAALAPGVATARPTATTLRPLPPQPAQPPRRVEPEEESDSASEGESQPMSRAQALEMIRARKARAQAAAPPVENAPPAAPPEAAPPAAPPAAPAPPRAAAPAAPAPAQPDAAAEPGAEEPLVEQPPLPLAPDATIEEAARVCRSTPNVQQCVELLGVLAGHKHAAVFQAVRQLLSSSHPAVRAAAEEAMARLFGPNWNRSLARPVPPPVQPPRSDDGGRGPHGAF